MTNFMTVRNNQFAVSDGRYSRSTQEEISNTLGALEDLQQTVIALLEKLKIMEKYAKYEKIEFEIEEVKNALIASNAITDF